MKQIRSKIDIYSRKYLLNQKQTKSVVIDFKSKLKNIQHRKKNFAIKKYESDGKLFVRDRIELLLDKDTLFLEFSPMAAINQYENTFPSAGIITGIGIIKGHETVIIANDATVKGGTYIKETIKKHLRAQEIALKNNLPCVYLVDSGGIFLPEQANVFPDKYDFGRIFYNQAQLSAEGIPQIAVVMGSCTAGGAYIPAMSDESIIVKNQGTIFLGGPPLVEAATGEKVTAEELGGGEVHTSLSGVADHLADNDEHAIQICRDIFTHLNYNVKQKLNIQPEKEPKYEAEELYGIIETDVSKQVNPYEIIARLVDGSEFNEFKANYGKTLVTGYAHIKGFPVGIIANNGILFYRSAQKGTHFIELCSFRKIPLVFLQNITGFMVGKESEHHAIVKEGAKMVHAVANANVPKFTIITGGSFGAGNYAMAGRAFDPNLLFIWPNAKISVMGGKEAAQVLMSIKKQQLLKKNVNFDHDKLKVIENSIVEKYRDESTAYYSTSRLWDDGIIDPIDTRDTLALGISMSLNKKIDNPRSGIYRM